VEPEKAIIAIVLSSIVVVGLVIGVAILTFPGNGNGGTTTPPEITTITEDTDLISLELQAPNWELEMSDETTLNVHDLQGRVVIVDLMATWCTACATQNSILQEIYNDYGNAIWIISLSTDMSETIEMMADYMEDKELPWPHGLDTDSVFSNYFDLQYLPTMIIIDSEGYFRWVHVGVWPADTMRNVISSIFSS
jgi:thiol-disulfide isomerase/thioredoxin